MTKPQFYTKRGWLTRYGLACGYIEKSGSDESYKTLEQISSNGTLRVVVSGRWHRASWEYHGPDLAFARRVFASIDPHAYNEFSRRQSA